MEPVADRDYLKSAAAAAPALTIVSAREPLDVKRTENAAVSSLLSPQALWVDETDQSANVRAGVRGNVVLVPPQTGTPPNALEPFVSNRHGPTPPRSIQF